MLRRAAVALVALVVAAGVLLLPAASRPAEAQARERLYLVTDSVVLGAVSAIQNRMPEYQLWQEGGVGVSVQRGLELVRRARPSIQRVAVVALGNNYWGDRAQLRRQLDGILEALRGVERVVLVNVRVWGPRMPEVNAEIAAAAARWPGTRIADWASASAAGGLTWSDGIHLTPRGAGVVADLVAGQVRGGRSGPAPASAPRAPARPLPMVDAAIAADGTGGYVLDSAGGLKPAGTAPAARVALAAGPARALGLRPDGRSGWVLDGFGGLLPFGGAPPVVPSRTWPGWDVARRVAVAPDGASGYVLDGFGGLHPFGTAPPVTTTFYAPGWDIARDLVLRSDGRSGWVLDAFGGLHPFGGAPAAAPTRPYWAPLPVARLAVLGDDGQGYLLDAFGGLHTVGGAPPVVPLVAPGVPPVRDATFGAAGSWALDEFGGIRGLRAAS